VYEAALFRHGYGIRIDQLSLKEKNGIEVMLRRAQDRSMSALILLEKIE
jgi:hypothetical protein